jgi:hypothetical protein
MLRRLAGAQVRALGSGASTPPPQRFRPRSVARPPPPAGTWARQGAAVAAPQGEQHWQQRGAPAPGALASAGAGAGAGASASGDAAQACDVAPGEQQKQQQQKSLSAKRAHLEHCKETNRRLIEAVDTVSVIAIVRAEGVARLNHVNACTALHQVAKRCSSSLRPSTTELELLTELLVAKLPRFDARAVASSLWSLATLRHHPGLDVLDRMSSTVELTSVQFNSQAVANCLWACKCSPAGSVGGRRMLG